jgi:hypothetical protein
MTQSIQKQILPNSKASTVSPAQKKKNKNKKIMEWAWWHTAVNPALGRWRQKNVKSKVSLGYIAS